MSTLQKSGKKTVEEKFREAQRQQQEAIKKHLVADYESSSEEDELESESILCSVLQSYSQLGGCSDDLGRTQRFLEDAFQSGAAICLICIGSVKRTEAIWNCLSCFCFMHLSCIQRWARDSVSLNKEGSSHWPCPKCRHEYASSDIPNRYKCFCGHTEDPVFHPWLVPHSCGETCGKALQPLCGHDCLLLCHPGPCPPCPKMVRNTCYCTKSALKPRRCSQKTWSCGKLCGAKLSCQKHSCTRVCHAGPCPPCLETSLQSCECGSEKQIRSCASPVWQCYKVCKKPLSCGYHSCERQCHKDSCGPCPLEAPRTCPCGKSHYTLPCTQETPTCGDTCGLLLQCGAHHCSRRCHRDNCGTCLEVVSKPCRCGLHTKEQPCKKEFLCESKCRRTKNCGRHQCNRKCCDGNCPPCEKPCSRTLACGTHKCASVCHRGQCYPCPLTAEIKCRCSKTVLSVPCGRQKHTKPPRCTKPCRLPPKCHHPTQKPHRCHFGDCPQCQQMCGRIHEICKHSCPEMCHSAVLVKIESIKKPIGPWEKQAAQFEIRDLSCPDCKVPVPVTCLGGHDTSNWPCYLSKPSSCQRSCGRMLKCGNHMCSRPCHVVEGSSPPTEAGDSCETCEEGCLLPRPEGCTHRCPRPCHPAPCEPCRSLMKLRCHCGLNQLFVRCVEWTTASTETKDSLQSCGNQCPKNFQCGHRCRANCHSGECPDYELCQKKVKLFCKCHRIRREISCALVRENKTKVECDAECFQKNSEKLKAKELQLLELRREEERRNQEELERFQKKFGPHKKNRNRRQTENDSGNVKSSKTVWILGIVVVALSLFVTFNWNNFL